jgi:predicted  nucleic acid-binding Zn-ribbon protein
MSDEVQDVPRTYSGALLAAIAVALLAAIGGLIWTYTLTGKLGTQQSELTEAKQQNVKLEAELRETDARLKVATDELSTSLGLTQKQLDARAQEIMTREAADNRRLENAQRQTNQQVTAVSSAVTDVKTDVGGVKTDVAKTQTDLAAAVAQLT